MNQCISSKELAEVLDVSKDTINSTVQKLELDGVLRRDDICRNNYGGYMFDESQAIAIKTEIAKHHNLASRKVDLVTSELEENQMIAQALSILTRRSDELRRQLEVQTERAEHFERENKLLMHTTRLYTVTEIAKELGYPSAIELNKVLEDKGIQYKVNGTWVPTAKFSSCGYFEIKQEVHDNGFVYYDRKVTQEGRSFILKLLA